MTLLGFKKCLIILNDHENTIEILSDAAKSMLRGIFIYFNAYIRKKQKYISVICAST